ncbi:MAG: hypothetical protein Q9219_001700 [cf. Caloplaca sp. 3 TL-2023]
MAKMHDSDGTQVHRVALFGPQITKWTQEGLYNLQTKLYQDPELSFLKEAFARLPSWPANVHKRVHIDLEKGFEELQEFARGKKPLDLQQLGNTQLAPITVISQVVDFWQRCKSPEESHGELGRFEAAQGFCIGFLSAAALSSSSDWREFRSVVSNGLRLAACIGITLDAEEMFCDPSERMTAVSVRWKTDSERLYLETCLDQFPEAYVSCITDEKTLTVTLPRSDQQSLQSRLHREGIASTAIGLDGSYHSLKNRQSAELLRQLCEENEDLRLPDASRLHLPLRSTANAELVRTGRLHEIAIDATLCKRAHWFQTIKSTVADSPLDHWEFTSFGKNHCVPRSLSQERHDGLLNGIPKREYTTLTDRLEEIAIVGIACRYPEADSVEELWQLISSGKTALSKLPDWRFNSADVEREPKLDNFWGNFLRHPDVFDHRFFDLSGREAKSMDPQQRLALQVAYESLESYGYFNLPRETDVGCYLGVGAVDYEDNVASEDANAFSALGTLRSFISGRISHFFGWEGPSITFDTACSSSAVAIHSACKALLGGECTLALAGGVNVITSPNLHQNLAAASFLNPNGSSRAFDAKAGGYCRGEGAGMLVLKPLSRAVADGDAVLGVVAASAVNQGSNCSAITVPDSHSQSSLYNKVLSAGGIDPKDITFVEAHGTGTPVGDPIEYESVRLALARTSRSEPLFLGSVKDNIGHTEAASGAAAVIKTILMMQHKTIPKQANFESLNPRIQPSPNGKIEIPVVSQPWIARRRVALVNNYGAAGSNAAIAIREHHGIQPSSKRLPNKDHHFVGPYPLMISAKSENSVKMYLNALKTFAAGAEARIADIASKLARMQSPSFKYRLAFPANELKDIASVDECIITCSEQPKVVLAFGGQTGNIVTVSRDLYDQCDLFQKHLVCATG